MTHVTGTIYDLTFPRARKIKSTSSVQFICAALHHRVHTSPCEQGGLGWDEMTDPFLSPPPPPPPLPPTIMMAWQCKDLFIGMLYRSQIYVPPLNFGLKFCWFEEASERRVVGLVKNKKRHGLQLRWEVKTGCVMSPCSLTLDSKNPKKYPRVDGKSSSQDLR